jgi:hypothetical protein
MAGYSPRSLSQKLGLKDGMSGLFVQPPDDYQKTLGPLPGGLSFRTATLKAAQGAAVAKSAPFAFIQCFFRLELELKMALPALKKNLSQQGMLWISWPKRTAAKAVLSAAALDEHKVRAAGLAAGLVDIKVCAVDETWSGLNFVYRLKDRKA